MEKNSWGNFFDKMGHKNLYQLVSDSYHIKVEKIRKENLYEMRHKNMCSGIFDSYLTENSMLLVETKY